MDALGTGAGPESRVSPTSDGQTSIKTQQDSGKQQSVPRADKQPSASGTHSAAAGKSLGRQHLPSANSRHSSDRQNTNRANQASDSICLDQCLQCPSGADGCHSSSDQKPQRWVFSEGEAAQTDTSDAKVESPSGGGSDCTGGGHCRAATDVHETCACSHLTEDRSSASKAMHNHGCGGQDKLPGNTADNSGKRGERLAERDSGLEVSDSATRADKRSRTSTGMAVADLNVCDMNLNGAKSPGQQGSRETTPADVTPPGNHSKAMAKSRKLKLPQILTSAEPTPDETSGSIKSSPGSVRSVSPTSWSVTSASPLQSPLRQRSLGGDLSTRSLEALLGGNGSSSLRLARDHHQPHSGSITDIHTEASTDDAEEADVFDLAPMQRPRARTWSENRAWQRMRKARVKAMTRPPTPPPGGADRFMVEKKLQCAASKEKLKIPDRELPGLPETLT